MEGVDEQRRRVNPDVIFKQWISMFAPRLQGASPKREPQTSRGQPTQLIQHPKVWDFSTWLKSVPDIQNQSRAISPQHTPTAGVAPKTTETSPELQEGVPLCHKYNSLAMRARGIVILQSSECEGEGPGVAKPPHM